MTSQSQVLSWISSNELDNNVLVLDEGMIGIIGKYIERKREDLPSMMGDTTPIVAPFDHISHTST